MVRYEIGIVETRNIIKCVLDDYGYDFRDYALTSFKRRLEAVITNHGMKDGEALVNKIKQSKEFFETFLNELTPDTTEMFRDPSLWRALSDDIFPQLGKSSTKAKVWLASFDSGEELYSLCIALKEFGILENVQIYVSTICDRATKRVQSGELDPKKMETNEANYTRANGTEQYTDYYTIINGLPTFDTSLLKDIKYVKQDTLYSNAPGGIKLFLFRNQLIYYNGTLQEKILNKLTDSLVPGGFMAIGAKETLDNSSANNKFTIVNDSERIYTKKLA